MASKRARSETHIVSPSLLQDLDLCQPVAKDLQIGWEEGMGMPVNPTDYMHQPDMSSEEIEQLFLMASQTYESGELRQGDHKELVRHSCVRKSELW